MSVCRSDQRFAGGDPIRGAPRFSGLVSGQSARRSLETSLAQMLGSGVEFIAALASQVAQSGLTVLNTVAILFITPVVAFGLLLDWGRDGAGDRQISILREHQAQVRGVIDR